ncbi:MAG: ATP-binding protein, partial [Fusobacteriaceae bacterium]
MKFNDTMLACKLIIESGAVPLIVGHAGIGKTTLVKKIAKKHGAHFVSIDANLLKEGEIGGLPVVDEYIFHEGKGKRTIYAVHNKFLEIEKILKEKPEQEIILFIDELNRCEHAVQQELMNLVLNREINGYYLHKNIK